MPQKVPFVRWGQLAGDDRDCVAQAVGGHGSSASGARRQWPRVGQAELLALRAEYAAWSNALPVSLHEGTMAETLEDIADLDLDDLAAIAPPHKYGRDKS
jgi:hypothetical protein